jgi:hypothetical protein
MKAPTTRPAAHKRTGPRARAGTEDVLVERDRREQQRLAKQRRAFLAAAAQGDLATLVQIARQAMRDRIWAWNAIAEDTVPLDLIADLVGAYPKDIDGSMTWEAYGNAATAAFALGIATGQLVHPDVFTMGGAE